MKSKEKSRQTPIETVKHQDKRANIPTEELRDFVTDEQKKPVIVLYPRDPSLDPQLVWTGKDEQDRTPLEVPALPIYIQEKIRPKALIEDLRAQARKVHRRYRLLVHRHRLQRRILLCPPRLFLRRR